MNSNEPAWESRTVEPLLTKREYFAAHASELPPEITKALCEMMRLESDTYSDIPWNDAWFHLLANVDARWRRWHADALLAELERTESK